MTTTVKVSANGRMVLPEALRKRRGIQAGTALRVTEAGDSILLTPISPPTEEELQAVIEAAGGPGPAEPRHARKLVEAAIERVRARPAVSLRGRAFRKSAIAGSTKLRVRQRA
ncbi:MAG: AbrB/MazE/SpoVT family DNA-binding domain-containing protein [Verrucomicrobia bacterium]|nr:AbrB/MazE/SpoVT family DNA-binding domain-containing protein [Verrucomicrobiota bacterium]